MTVPVRGSIRLDKGGRWLAEISRRLIALEKASGGTASSASGPAFASPASPPFGGGAPGGPSGGGGSSTSTTVVVETSSFSYPAAHVHGAQDILGLNDFFYRRHERTPPQPHVHLTNDIADLNPADSQWILAARIFGG